MEVSDPGAGSSGKFGAKVQSGKERPGWGLAGGRRERVKTMQNGTVEISPNGKGLILVHATGLRGGSVPHTTQSNAPGAEDQE